MPSTRRTATQAHMAEIESRMEAVTNLSTNLRNAQELYGGMISSESLGAPPSPPPAQFLNTWSSLSTSDLHNPVLDLPERESTHVTRLNYTVLDRLRKVEEILRSANILTITLAGGAPRDLYNNILSPVYSERFVKDFDYFLECDISYISKPILESLGFEDVTVLSNEDYELEDLLAPIFVARGYYKGLEINFVVQQEGITSDELIQDFSCSLSKFELILETGALKATKEARLSMLSKVLVFKPNTSDSYKLKVSNYFPDFRVGSYQDAVMALVDKQINTLPEYFE